LQIVWTRSAEKDLRGIAKATREQILDAVEAFAMSGVGDVKRLQGVDEFRLRVGRYRVRFALDQVAGTMIILHVRHRREAYR
jgi:mRNA interferase RelE/StbE